MCTSTLEYLIKNFFSRYWLDYWTCHRHSRIAHGHVRSDIRRLEEET